MPRHFNLVLLIALAACGGDPLLDRIASDTTSVGQLHIHTVFALPPFTDAPMPVYLTVVNEGEADMLLEASSPSTASVAIHGAGMADLAVTPVPANGELALRPGGLHLMLAPPLPPTARGDSIEVTLRFALNGRVTLRVPVIDYDEADAVRFSPTNEP